MYTKITCSSQKLSDFYWAVSVLWVMSIEITVILWPTCTMPKLFQPLCIKPQILQPTCIMPKILQPMCVMPKILQLIGILAKILQPMCKIKKKISAEAPHVIVSHIENFYTVKLCPLNESELFYWLRKSIQCNVSFQWFSGASLLFPFLFKFCTDFVTGKCTDFPLGNSV